MKSDANILMCLYICSNINWDGHLIYKGLFNCCSWPNNYWGYTRTKKAIENKKIQAKSTIYKGKKRS